MREIDELRPLTAGRLLTLWRESRQAAEEPVERALLCNAGVLAESCRFQGEAAFESPEAVLAELTMREMEALLRQLSGPAAAFPAGEENPCFDEARFARLREG